MNLAPGIRRYFFNTSWLVVARVLRLLVAFGISVVIARYLGRELFGRLSYAISFVMLFGAVGSLGIDDILVRGLVAAHQEDDGAEGCILGTASGLRIASSVLMACLALGTAKALDCSTAVLGMMVLVSCGALLTNVASGFEKYFEARVRAKYAAWSQMVAVFVSAIVTATLVVLHAPLIWFASVKAVEAFALLVALVLLMRFSREWLPLGWSWQRAGAFLRDGWPLFLTSVFILVYMRIDQVMVKHWLGEGAVGCYAVAVRLSEACYFVPTVVVNSLFPAILNARARDRELYASRVQRLYELMTWLGVAVAVVLTVAAPFVVRLTYGAEFAPAVPVLGLYAWAGVFVFQGVARGKWIVAENLQRYAIVFTASACLVNVVLNAILIERMGLRGAALATVVCCACQTLVFPCLFRATRPSVAALLRAFWPKETFSWAMAAVSEARGRRLPRG